MKLSEHFTLDEFLISQTAARLGIDNSPTPEVLENLKRLAVVMEDVRIRLGKPITITSGYRSPALNASVPGSSNKSAHMLGLAADFICPSFGGPLEVAKAVAETNIQFDQLIHEFGTWVHLGLSDSPRKQLLTASIENGKTLWRNGLC